MIGIAALGRQSRLAKIGRKVDGIARYGDVCHDPVDVGEAEQLDGIEILQGDGQVLGASWDVGHAEGKRARVDAVRELRRGHVTAVFVWDGEGG